ncbi:MAG: hypothetical protein ABW034_04095, partial [Steroidobacteraceae bacterium]
MRRIRILTGYALVQGITAFVMGIIFSHSQDWPNVIAQVILILAAVAGPVSIRQGTRLERVAAMQVA